MLCLGHAKGPAMHEKQWLLWQLDISIAYKFRLLTMIVCWLTSAKAQLQGYSCCWVKIQGIDCFFPFFYPLASLDDALHFPGSEIVRNDHTNGYSLLQAFDKGT